MQSFNDDQSVSRIAPPMYLVDGNVVALERPNSELTVGWPFAEVVDGMPRWYIPADEAYLIYRRLKKSMTAIGLSFLDLESRFLYKSSSPMPPPRRIRMRKLSGLLLDRMASIAIDVAHADEANKMALKLYQMLPVDHRACLDHHVQKGPHIAQGYELHEHQQELVQIGLLTRIVVSGKTGSIAANMTAVHVYTAGLAVSAESHKGNNR